MMFIHATAHGAPRRTSLYDESARVDTPLLQNAPSCAVVGALLQPADESEFLYSASSEPKWTYATCDPRDG
jgi:hypothetical protein